MSPVHCIYFYILYTYQLIQFDDPGSMMHVGNTKNCIYDECHCVLFEFKLQILTVKLNVLIFTDRYCKDFYFLYQNFAYHISTPPKISFPTQFLNSSPSTFFVIEFRNLSFFNTSYNLNMSNETISSYTVSR